MDKSETQSAVGSTQFLGVRSMHMPPDENNECGDDESCDRCGGDGVIMLSEAGPGIWGEDCFCDEDRPITCPSCRGDGARTPNEKAEP